MAPAHSIFSTLARSPIRPLQKHMNVVQSCVELLVPFFEAVFNGDWKAVETSYAEINELEKAADKLKIELRLQLPKGLFLTIPRADIFVLVDAQDRIANKAQDIAGLVYGRRMKIPKQLVPVMKTFLDRCLEASRQSHQAIHELDELLSTGFSGSEVEILSGMLTNLNKIENDTDAQQVKVREALCKLEGEMPAIDVIFLYRVIEAIGGLADRAQILGARLQLLLAK